MAGADPGGAGDPTGGLYAETVQQVLAPEKPWGSPLILLILSGLAFGLVAKANMSAQRLAVLVGVLVFHELGHWAGMRVFGYRDVRMFFIPFFGAAVSGQPGAAAAWKRGVVTLLGPLPGLVVAAALAASGQRSQPWGPDVISMLTLINAFNLLPLEPLDGGRLVLLLLRNSHPALETGIVLCSGVVLAGIGIASGDHLLVGLGLGLALHARFRWQFATAARTLRRSAVALPPDLTTTDDAQRRMLFAAVRPLVRSSIFAKPAQVAARLMHDLYERLVVPRPSRATSLLLIVLYVTGWGLAATVPWSVGKTAQVSLSRAPLDVEVIPGALHVRVSAHDVPTRAAPIRSWTFRSSGLWALGQKEILLTVKERANESDDDYPREVLRYYADVYGLAKQHRIVDVGDMTIYDRFEVAGRKGLLGREDFLGLLYLAPMPFVPPETSEPTITAIIVTREEAESARQFGSLRILAALGNLGSMWPTMYWVDRDRAPLDTPTATREQSVLTQLTRISLAGTFVTQIAQGVAPMGGPLSEGAPMKFEGATVRLSLLATQRERLRDLLDGLSSDQPFAILGGSEPTASASFVWVPGLRRAPGLIADSGCEASRTSADFLILSPLPSTGSTSSAVLVEDGFALMLTQADWSTIRDGMRTGKPARVAVHGAADALELQWNPDDTEATDPGNRRASQTD